MTNSVSFLQATMSYQEIRAGVSQRARGLLALMQRGADRVVSRQTRQMTYGTIGNFIDDRPYLAVRSVLASIYCLHYLAFFFLSFAIPLLLPTVSALPTTTFSRLHPSPTPLTNT